MIWYPTYFILKRILFCLTTLYYWNSPLKLLAMRFFIFMISFVIKSVKRPFADPLNNRLELMNETTTILLIDCMFIFTNGVNSGNPDDLNQGNVSSVPIAHQITGYIYITIFVINIAVHLIILMKSECKSLKNRF